MSDELSAVTQRIVVEARRIEEEIRDSEQRAALLVELQAMATRLSLMRGKPRPRLFGVALPWASQLPGL